jgi:hypothetical protein
MNLYNRETEKSLCICQDLMFQLGSSWAITLYVLDSKMPLIVRYTLDLVISFQVKSMDITIGMNAN